MITFTIATIQPDRIAGRIRNRIHHPPKNKLIAFDRIPVPFATPTVIGTGSTSLEKGIESVNRRKLVSWWVRTLSFTSSEYSHQNGVIAVPVARQTHSVL